MKSNDIRRLIVIFFLPYHPALQPSWWDILLVSTVGIKDSSNTLTLLVGSEGFWSVQLAREEPAAPLQPGVDSQRALEGRGGTLQPGEVREDYRINKERKTRGRGTPWQHHQLNLALNDTLVCTLDHLTWEMAEHLPGSIWLCTAFYDSKNSHTVLFIVRNSSEQHVIRIINHLIPLVFS